MKKITHTPGPWDIHTDSKGGLEIHPAWDEHGERTIADIIGSMPHDHKNAQLIAAAPELLEALEYAFMTLGATGANADTMHVNRQCWELCRKVIAKAKDGGQ